VELNRAVAVAPRDGPAAGPVLLDALDLVGNEPERAFLRRRPADVTQGD
jgi:hypothetical protein